MANAVSMPTTLYMDQDVRHFWMFLWMMLLAAPIARASQLIPSRFEFSLSQTIETKPVVQDGTETPTLGTILGSVGGGSAKVEGTLSICKLASEGDSSLWRVHLEESAGQADVFAIFSPSGQILSLFKSKVSSDLALGHAKQLTSALQHPNRTEVARSGKVTATYPSPLGLLELDIFKEGEALKQMLRMVHETPGKMHTEKLQGLHHFDAQGMLSAVEQTIDWHQDDLRGQLLITLKRQDGEIKCPKERDKLAQPLVAFGVFPEQWDLNWNKQAPLKQLEEKRMKHLESLSIKELLTSTGNPQTDSRNASLATEVLKENKKGRLKNISTAITLFERATRKKDDDSMIRIAGVLSQTGNAGALRAIAQAAALPRVSSETAERLVRTLFFSPRSDALTAATLIKIFENKKRTFSTRDASLLVAASLTSISKSPKQRTKMERYLQKKLKTAQKKTEDPFLRTYENAIANLKPSAVEP